MGTNLRRNGFDRVLVDLNTQCDYLLPTGAAPVLNRAHIVPNIRRLMDWARHSATPVVSSLNANRPTDNFNGTPRHCIDQTPGQRKLPFTLLPRRILLPGDNTLDLPIDLLRRYRQVIFPKHARDLLTNPKADRLLTDIPAAHLIIFGMVCEHCVKATVLALLTRQRNVVVVRDACGFWNQSEADLALRQMEAKGAFLFTADQIVTNVSLPERIIVTPPDPEDDARAADGNGKNGQRGRTNHVRAGGIGRLAAKPVRVYADRQGRWLF